MIKKIASLFTILLLVGCSNQGLSGSTLPSSWDHQSEQVSRMLDSTVLLLDDSQAPHPQMVRRERTLASCSGIWISRRQFITAFHCVQRQREIPISVISNLGILESRMTVPDTSSHLNLRRQYSTYRDYRRLNYKQMPLMRREARVVKEDLLRDMVMLRVEGQFPQHSVAQVARQNRTYDAPIISVGHPGGLPYVITRGRITRPSWYMPDSSRLGNVRLLQVADAEIFYGSSGGPAFNEDGFVTGMNVVVMRGQSYLAGSIPSSEIRDFLER